MTASVPMCRHCGSRVATHGRGLCQTCYVKTTIRDLYPPDRPPNRRVGMGINLNGRNLQPASSPTLALPGTPEKIKVMRERAMAGEELHHPKDVKEVMGVGVEVCELYRLMSEWFGD